MRTGRVHIASFGGVRDRTYTFGPGLNIIYGPNESGKTTLKSFITGTLFPEKLPPYPESKTSDSGEVDVVLSDGTCITVKRSGKKSDSTIPEICKVNSAEYRSIYSLDTDDLRDMEMVEKGGIRNRLLVVPGSESVPRAEKDIAVAKSSLIPEGRRSKSCEISTRKAELDVAEERLVSLKKSTDGDEAFNDLVAREAILERQLGEATVAEQKALERLTLVKKSEGRRDILNKIAEQEKEREGLTYSSRADAERERVYAELSGRRRNQREEVKNAHNALEHVRSPGPLSEAGVKSLREACEHLSSGVSGYRYMSNNRTTVVPARRGSPILIAVGGAVAVAGVAISIVANVVAGVTIAAIGVVITIISMRKKPETVTPNPDAERGIATFEEEWKNLCTSAKITPSSPEEDVVRVRSLISSYEEYNRLVKESESKESALKKTEEDISLLTSPFGGEEGLMKAFRDRRKLESLDESIRTLKETAGDDADIPKESPADADAAYAQAKSRKESIATELSALRARKESILNDTDTEKAITDLNSMRYAYTDAVKRWATLAFESVLLSKACDNAYDRNQPSAFRDANRFLTEMTSDRYAMAGDPRDNGIASIDTTTGVRKDEKTWSAGTEDQVKLSLKMGLALSLSSEEIPPVMLDDVLLTSDSARLEGGARAIAELARSTQVLYFTCSKESADALRAVGGSITEL